MWINVKFVAFNNYFLVYVSHVALCYWTCELFCDRVILTYYCICKQKTFALCWKQNPSFWTCSSLVHLFNRNRTSKLLAAVCLLSRHVIFNTFHTSFQINKSSFTPCLSHLSFMLPSCFRRCKACTLMLSHWERLAFGMRLHVFLGKKDLGLYGKEILLLLHIVYLTLLSAFMHLNATKMSVRTF